MFTSIKLGILQRSLDTCNDVRKIT